MTIVGDNHNSIELYTIETTNVQENDTIKTNQCKISDDPNDKKLLRKLDLHLVPTMTLFCLLSYLDRVNIGQAKLVGLMESLKLTSIRYNVCLSVFFITYVAFEIPSNLVLKRLRPSRWLPTIMIAWGIVMTLMGLVHSYGGLLACRLALGAAESGLFPGAIFYLSCWYKRRELSWRISILFSAYALGGAVGGILAFGIGQMRGIGGQEGWRWIFYLEGMMTVVVGAAAFFLINDFPSDRPKFLTEEECDRTITRLQNDAGPGAGEHFSWKQVRAAFLDWKIYIFCLCTISVLVPFASLSLVSPTIIHGLGFQSYRAQLMTAPPYAFACITTMATAYFSDRYARRAIFIMFWLIVVIICFIILIVVQNLSVKYFAVFLAIGGISPCNSICLTFLSCNISPHTKRATALAFMSSVGNFGGIISGQIYRSQDGPRFILGHGINLGFCVLGLIAVIILFISLRLENHRRDRLYGVVSSSNRKASVVTKETNKEVVDIYYGCGSEEDRRKWGYEHMSEEEIRDLGDKHTAWRYIL
ncbi:unnamed protein product [Adineta steineri]|uniref:Major facilitator superfamily (MFS) profile domain-containing protein n=1 Tax=Adineta steineri TaxID=433720 RepID=A0A814LYP5_9BILA|nr:unnamed protein product [Adineta steineri]CAF1322740.1 unnamed protein product [Adineta steineri]